MSADEILDEVVRALEPYGLDGPREHLGNSARALAAKLKCLGGLMDSLARARAGRNDAVREVERLRAAVRKIHEEAGRVLDKLHGDEQP